MGEITFWNSEKQLGIFIDPHDDSYIGLTKDSRAWDEERTGDGLGGDVDMYVSGEAFDAHGRGVRTRFLDNYQGPFWTYDRDILDLHSRYRFDERMNGGE